MIKESINGLEKNNDSDSIGFETAEFFNKLYPNDGDYIVIFTLDRRSGTKEHKYFSNTPNGRTEAVEYATGCSLQGLDVYH